MNNKFLKSKFESAFFNLTDNPSFILDKEGFIKLVNSAWEKTLGWGTEDLQSLHLQKLISAKDLPKILETFDSCEPDKTRECTAELLSRTEGYQAFNWKVYKNRENFFSVLLQSPTNETQNRFESLINCVSDVIAIIDANKNCRYVNASIKKILGYNTEQLIDSNILDIIHPENYLKVNKVFEKILKRNSLEERFQSRFLKFDSSWTEIECICHNHLNDPLINGIVINLRDVSDQKIAEKALKQIEERFEAFMQNNPSSSWITNNKGKILFVNRAYLKTFDLKQKNIVGKSIFDVYQKNIAQPFLENIEHVFQNRTILETMETAPRKGGDIGHFIVYKFPLNDLVGGVAVDITEYKKSEREKETLLEQSRLALEEAEAANRIKDEFLAILSHELRTPLNPILGWSNFLLRNKVDDETMRAAIESIERNAKLQTQLIEDLLDISRIIRGKMNLKTEEVNFVEVIEQAIETVHLAAEVKEVQIEKHYEKFDNFIVGDRGRLQQIVWNLLSNAIKFTPAEGKVKITLLEREQKIELIVEDNGKGISASFLPQIFQHFSQADSSISRNYGGLGLGLAIAKHLVELHGGSLWAESEGEGKGSKFTVSFPFKPVSGCPTRQVKTQTAATNLQNKNFLIIDDDRDSREFFQFLLSGYGANVITASSAAEAHKILQTNIIDLIICDIALPEEDGYSFVQKIKKNFKNLPVMALTAFASDADRNKALSSGFASYVSKPADPQEFIKIVSALIPCESARN